MNSPNTLNLLFSLKFHWQFFLSLRKYCTLYQKIEYRAVLLHIIYIHTKYVINPVNSLFWKSVQYFLNVIYTGCLQMNGAVSKVNKNLFSPYTGKTYTVSSGNCPSSLCVNHNPSMCALWVTQHTSTRWSNSSQIRCSMSAVIVCSACVIRSRSSLRDISYVNAVFNDPPKKEIAWC